MLVACRLVQLSVSTSQAKGLESMGVLEALKLRKVIQAVANSCGLDAYAVLKVGKTQQFTSRTVVNSMEPTFNQVSVSV